VAFNPKYVSSYGILIIVGSWLKIKEPPREPALRIEKPWTPEPAAIPLCKLASSALNYTRQPVN